MNKQDMCDLKALINEQFDLIQRLMPLIYAERKDSKDFQDIYEDILYCNDVMMEIVCGPTGGIEKLVERTIGK